MVILHRVSKLASICNVLLRDFTLHPQTYIGVWVLRMGSRPLEGPDKMRDQMVPQWRLALSCHNMFQNMRPTASTISVDLKNLWQSASIPAGRATAASRGDGYGYGYLRGSPQVQVLSIMPHNSNVDHNLVTCPSETRHDRPRQPLSSSSCHPPAQKSGPGERFGRTSG